MSAPGPHYIKNSEQLGVTKRNLLIKVMDALGCSKREALMIMASFAQVEKAHPEYGIQKIPFPKLLDAIKQTYIKNKETQALHKGLSAPVQETGNLDNFLNSNK
jgi:hypothetical protein